MRDDYDLMPVDYERLAELSKLGRIQAPQPCCIVSDEPNPPDERVPHDATCSGCRWWSTDYPNRSAPKYGHCHRRAPAMWPDREWPNVRDDNLCGDWEPKGGE